MNRHRHLVPALAGAVVAVVILGVVAVALRTGEAGPDRPPAAIDFTATAYAMCDQYAVSGGWIADAADTVVVHDAALWHDLRTLSWAAGLVDETCLGFQAGDPYASESLLPPDYVLDIMALYLSSEEDLGEAVSTNLGAAIVAARPSVLRLRDEICNSGELVVDPYHRSRPNGEIGRFEDGYIMLEVKNALGTGTPISPQDVFTWQRLGRTGFAKFPWPGNRLDVAVVGFYRGAMFFAPPREERIADGECILHFEVRPVSTQP